MNQWSHTCPFISPLDISPDSILMRRTALKAKPFSFCCIVRFRPEQVPKNIACAISNFRLKPLKQPCTACITTPQIHCWSSRKSISPESKLWYFAVRRRWWSVMRAANEHSGCSICQFSLRACESKLCKWGLRMHGLWNQVELDWHLDGQEFICPVHCFLSFSTASTNFSCDSALHVFSRLLSVHCLILALLFCFREW